TVDKALSQGCESIEKVIVLRRAGIDIELQQGRDVDWEEAIDGQPRTCEPEWVEAEHPLFILYTSGSTGKPKGVQHSSAGYLLGSMVTTKWAFDVGKDDIFWCTADVGWITGHTYIVYGPTALGLT